MAQMVKVRALMTVGQLRLRYGDVGEFPEDTVRPFLDLGRVELADPKPKRRPRSAVVDSSTDDDETGTDETGDQSDT